MTKFLRRYFGVMAMLLLLSQSNFAYAQGEWKRIEAKPSTLGLDKGLLTLNTPGFQLQLVKASQTIASLQPNSAPGFDFTPGDRLQLRSRDGMYHLGDLNLRIRFVGETDWKQYATAKKRGEVQPLSALPDSVLAASDLSGTLPADIPLNIRRYWELSDGKLVLVFKIKNTTSKAVEIGALGIPMIFNNLMNEKTLEEAHASNVFYDPYIGRDAGYLQVTRLSGHGPALVVVPYNSNTSFEAYNPLLDDPTPRGITFEGFYEWMVYSKAYAENEWKKAEPWNEPTSRVLQPGETAEYGVKFLPADSIRGIEQTLEENNRPVAIGIPGYVLPQDVNGKLFLNYRWGVGAMQVTPAGALTIIPLTTGGRLKSYSIEGNTWGRARLTITYNDGLCQTINYKVIKPEKEVLKDYGHFLTTKQWYSNKADPFGRDQSVITYDYEKKQQVTQDSRAWIAGLSDEGGAGSWLGAMMKELIQPDKTEIEKMQRFVDHTLWGNIQYTHDSLKYGVKKSVFYYQPNQMPPGTYSDSINYKTWAAWSHKDASVVDRSYDYPHVVAAHWVMYRLARDHNGLVTEHPWPWYLSNAYNTSMAMLRLAPYYAQFGQMEGDVFYLLLMDLKAEGWKMQAEVLEKAMKVRAGHWRTLQYPFGSEMPWDSTGQEEVYLWSSYFGYDEKAEVTLNAILGYMPTIPNWGYNGSARRYWDFLYGGKLSRIERQLHHYGSGLNAIPVLSAYRKSPDDLYLLRVGYGGLMGSISNITQDGFGPAAFHSFPSTLKIDGLSGDYGPNFFGYAVNSATYITHDKTLGWLAFGGNLETNNNNINVKITSGAANRIYITPAGLWLRLDAGNFESVSYNTKTGKVTLMLAPGNRYTPKAYLHVAQPAYPENQGKYKLDHPAAMVRGAYAITLSKGSTSIGLRRK